jgi:hypothetical protein
MSKMSRYYYRTVTEKENEEYGHVQPERSRVGHRNELCVGYRMDGRVVLSIYWGEYARDLPRHVDTGTA